MSVTLFDDVCISLCVHVSLYVYTRICNIHVYAYIHTFIDLHTHTSLTLQGPLRTQRSLFVTFLDDDLLIARDETGVPDIWLRKVHTQRHTRTRPVSHAPTHSHIHMFTRVPHTLIGEYERNTRMICVVDEHINSTTLVLYNTHKNYLCPFTKYSQSSPF